MEVEKIGGKEICNERHKRRIARVRKTPYFLKKNKKKEEKNLSRTKRAENRYPTVPSLSLFIEYVPFALGSSWIGIRINYNLILIFMPHAPAVMPYIPSRL